MLEPAYIYESWRLPSTTTLKTSQSNHFGR